MPSVASAIPSWVCSGVLHHFRPTWSYSTTSELLVTFLHLCGPPCTNLPSDKSNFSSTKSHILLSFADQSFASRCHLTSPPTCTPGRFSMTRQLTSFHVFPSSPLMWYPSIRVFLGRHRFLIRQLLSSATTSNPFNKHDFLAALPVPRRCRPVRLLSCRSLAATADGQPTSSVPK